jgi:hypothetical protein
VRFWDFEAVKKDILLYNSLLNGVIEKQPASPQLQLSDLQAEPFFMGMTKEFFRNLSSERFPNLSTFGLRMTSMFGTAYLCESASSTMIFIKSRHRSSLKNNSLLNLLRLARKEIQMDIQSFVADSERPPSSH